MENKPIYRSSNGDDWFMEVDGVGAATVVHRANLASGGTETRTPVYEFLQRGGGSPEAQAVRAALAAQATGGDLDVDRDRREQPRDDRAARRSKMAMHSVTQRIRFIAAFVIACLGATVPGRAQSASAWEVLAQPGTIY